MNAPVDIRWQHNEEAPADKRQRCQRTVATEAPTEELAGSAVSGRDSSRQEGLRGADEKEEEDVALRCGLWKKLVHAFS